ncbi:Hsp20/alpha crystallin family protein [Sphingobacterium anhuiense]|uniref:Hsp20/alpha crystallin family protein n=1 Tax=Sphingobacterium anhuiense TaxID=493780 RepID=A0ABW5YX34_9SPHI
MFNRNNNTADCFAKYSNLKNQFEQQFGKFRNEFSRDIRPLVNIEENSAFFTLQLYAAGLKKEQFKIEIKDKILTISYEAPVQDQSEEQYMYREFIPQSFRRSFQLNEQVSNVNLTASYEEGVLTVILPKDSTSYRPAQHVKVG